METIAPKKRNGNEKIRNRDGLKERRRKKRKIRPEIEKGKNCGQLPKMATNKRAGRIHRRNEKIGTKNKRGNSASAREREKN